MTTSCDSHGVTSSESVAVPASRCGPRPSAGRILPTAHGASPGPANR